MDHTRPGFHLGLGGWKVQPPSPPLDKNFLVLIKRLVWQSSDPSHVNECCSRVTLVLAVQQKRNLGAIWAAERKWLILFHFCSGACNYINYSMYYIYCIPSWCLYYVVLLSCPTQSATGQRHSPPWRWVPFALFLAELNVWLQIVYSHYVVFTLWLAHFFIQPPRCVQYPGRTGVVSVSRKTETHSDKSSTPSLSLMTEGRRCCVCVWGVCVCVGGVQLMSLVSGALVDMLCAIIPLVPLLCCVARWRLVNKLCLVVSLT